MKHPVATLIMKNGARIQMELYPENCVNCVNGFIESVDRHVYDNMSIERIVPGFVFQPWCSDDQMPDEYNLVCNLETDNNLNTFKAYSVGLAGDGETISVPWCFFITLSDKCNHLDHKFSKIGQVISGYEELQRIENVELKDIPTGIEGVKVMTPVQDEIIHTITIELNGYEPLPVIKHHE